MLPPLRQASVVPEWFDWPSLMSKDGDALETHYRHILEELGKAVFAGQSSDRSGEVLGGSAE
jgi:hypothetical protein